MAMAFRRRIQRLTVIAIKKHAAPAVYGSFSRFAVLTRNSGVRFTGHFRVSRF